MINGWTEFDMARIELELKEKRLQRAALMPKRETHRPIRSTLARTFMTLAHHLSTEHAPATPARNLTAGATET